PVPSYARAVDCDCDVTADLYETKGSRSHLGHASARRANDPDLRRPPRRHRYHHANALGASLIGLAEHRRDRTRLEAIHENEEALSSRWKRRRLTRDENGLRGTHRGDVERRVGRVAECVRDRLAGESHLEQDGGLGRRGTSGQPRAIEDALEQRRRIDWPRQPAADVVEAGTYHDVIGAHTQSERDEVSGFNPTVRARKDERRRTLRHVDRQRGGPVRRREGPRRVLDDLVTKGDVVVPSAAHRAEAVDHLGGGRETLELERVGAKAESVSDTRLDQAKDARHRPLRAASQTQRFEELAQSPLVLRSTVYHDDVRLCIAQGLGGLRERARIVRSKARNDLAARRERKLSNRETRRFFAAMNEGDAKGSIESDASLLDRNFGPGRDRHRIAVVVRAASWTKASNTPSTSGDIPWSFPTRSGCHCTPTSHRCWSDSNASMRSPTEAVARRDGASSFEVTA